MRVAVLMPVLRPGRELGDLMRALRSQTRPPDDIWVAETGPSRETADLVASLGGRYVEVPADGFDHAGTRTRLARNASADRVVLMSQDVILEQRDALERLLSPLERGVAAAYGRHLAGAESDAFTSFKRSFLYPGVSREWGLADRNREGFNALSFSNAFSAYRTDALAEVGWFGERRLMCEDISTAASLLLRGHRLAYAADAAVIHPQDHSLDAELRRYFDIGAVHCMDPRIGTEFGTPGRKGLRFTRAGAAHLWQSSPGRLPEFAMWCALKWVAYNLGRRCDRLPRRVCARLSGLPGWWLRDETPGRS